MRDEVMAVFREVVDLTPDARARYFEEHNVEADVRAEVESLLAFDSATEPFAGAVAEEAEQVLRGGAGARGQGAAPVRATYGPYRVVGVLGEGGMGIVYLAEQVEPVRRRVALKVTKHSATEPLIARFESERQALALLDHPNVAKLYDAGETPDGHPWFAMEYVPGLPITDYCDANQVSLRERLVLFQQVCRAVEHAHEKGIVHRDLKPSNILVRKTGGVATPKVIDFGVAKAINLRLTERTLFTEMGMLIGTPEYMSPEQAADAEISGATDIYSLGVVLYELLVGATPFDAKSLRSAGYNEICRIIRDTDPPRPTTRLHSMGDTAREIARRRGGTLSSLVRTLEGDLEWITMKALEKEPGRRYSSPGEFAADLDRHLRNEPVIARRPSAAYRLRKFVRRRRLELIAAVALLLAVATGVAALLRVGAPSGPTTMTQRRIELPGTSYDMAETDGRRLIFQDPANGDVFYSADAGKTRHVIFHDTQRALLDWAASKDFSAVALFLAASPTQPGSVGIVRTDGSGYRELLRGSIDDGFGDASTLGFWSWDNSSVLFCRHTAHDRRLISISATGGERKELAVWRKGRMSGGAFSPDGRFAAWQLDPELDESTAAVQIIVVPVQGGTPRVVYEESIANGGRSLGFLDWTADGRHLILVSGKTGRRALHLLPMRDGQRAGDPVFLRNVAIRVGYTVKSGAFIYRAVNPGKLWSMYLTQLDSAGRPDGWRKLDVSLQNKDNPWVTWSPDGKQIAYRSTDTEVGQEGNTVIWIRNLATGEDRQIYRIAEGTCAWDASDKIVCVTWGKATSELFAISPGSGQIQHIGDVPGRQILLHGLSRDNKSAFYSRVDDGAQSLVRWDIARRQADVLAHVDKQLGAWLIISPDERWAARLSEKHVDIKLVSSGTWKQAIGEMKGGQFTFSPDGNWIYFHGADTSGAQGLFRVSTAGGTPERLGDFPVRSFSGSLRISPDGRKLIAAPFDGSAGFETWSLENFVPEETRR